MANQRKRTLTFVCINHGHTVDLEDTGPGKDGEPTTARAAIVNMLAERTKVVIDGKEKILPIFLLAEPPKVVFNENDPLDTNLLRDKAGDWLLPFPEWIAIRDEKVDASDEASSAFAKQMREKDAHEIARRLVSFGPPDTGRGAKRERAPREDAAPEVKA